MPGLQALIIAHLRCGADRARSLQAAQEGKVSIDEETKEALRSLGCLR